MHLKFNRMAHKILLFVYFKIKISDIETTTSRLTERMTILHDLGKFEYFSVCYKRVFEANDWWSSSLQ